ncbi:acyltransferase [Microbacterium sp. ARD31]|uniref:acyltransferase family protein n=1 Tax=Microbacterium sp. ARD31 TaxID=2962576 RepID=UPI002881FC24|nr:acyltransferase [Microbacterium sp. ARD31]MDT0183230.1 acyltransferase [Microbacterium sp. ARD31]
MTKNAEQVVESARQSKGRLEYIDAIRGVGALLVAVQHPLEYAFPAYAQWSLQYINLGRVGIVAFFLVSGYVVGLTLSRQTVRTFAIRRFWRLYPIYWVATVAYVAVVVLTGQAPFDYSLVVILMNVTMLQGFFGVYSILGVAWTLGIEIAFYAQSILGKLSRFLEKSVWLGIGWLLVFAGMALANFAFGAEFTAVMPLMMFTASVGFAVYLWENGQSKALLLFIPLAVVLVPTLGWFLVSQHAGVRDAWTPLGFDLSYAGGLAIFAALYAVRSRKMHASLLWLGGISYSLYLVHTIVMAALKPLGLAPAVFVLVAIVGGILVAWGARILVERPTTDYGRRITSARQS